MRKYFVIAIVAVGFTLAFFGYRSLQKMALASQDETGRWSVTAEGASILLEMWPLYFLALATSFTIIGLLTVLIWKPLEDSDHETELSWHKAQTIKAQNTAKNAEERADKRVSAEWERARKTMIEAERKLSEANGIRAEANEEVRMIKEAANSRIHDSLIQARESNTRKERASGAMERHKRKIEKLRTDENELYKFCKKYHPNLIKSWVL